MIGILRFEILSITSKLFIRIRHGIMVLYIIFSSWEELYFIFES